MKQLRTVAAISAITLITAAPTFAEQTPSGYAVDTLEATHDVRRTVAVAAEKDEHQALVARVEAALRADPALVNTSNLVVLGAGSGEVTLSGSVDTNAQAARAAQVARNVAGVTGIEDKLVRESEFRRHHISPLTTVDPPLAQQQAGKTKTE